MNKTCKICKQTKSPEEFSLDPSTTALGTPVRKDGRHPYCKECVSKMHRESYKRNPQIYKDTNKKWADKNKDKVNIYGRVQWALKSGIITKPNKCNLCDQNKPLVAHHWHGYDEKHVLDVKWLCRSCHKKVHILKSKKHKIVYNGVVDILGL